MALAIKLAKSKSIPISSPDLVLTVSGGCVPDVPTINSPRLRIRSNVAPPKAGPTAKQQITSEIKTNKRILLIPFLLFNQSSLKNMPTVSSFVTNREDSLLAQQTFLS
jgi:hypothetical protein